MQKITGKTLLDEKTKGRFEKGRSFREEIEISCARREREILKRENAGSEGPRNESAARAGHPAKTG
jgi:hypothetical protein